jgi:hypothetical protein
LNHSGTPIGFSLEKDGFGITGGLLNITKRGTSWECFQPESHKLLAIDSPDFTYTSNAWWLPFQGRVGELNPRLGNMEEEAAENLKQNLISEIGSFVAHPVIGTLSLIII